MNDKPETTVKKIEPISIGTGTGIGGSIAAMRATLEAKAEERNLSTAANALFSLRSKESWLRIAATFDQLVHVSELKAALREVENLKKQVATLSKSNGKLSENLGNAGKKASRVAVLERQLADQKEAFEAVLKLFDIDPTELDTMVASLESENANERAVIAAADRDNRNKRASISKLSKLSGTI